MPEDPFLLVSLEESESKELAKVISNKTSRKILNLLSKKNATETEIAKELQLPLSTVHYNLQHLLKANLVKTDEFHYSEKGKEVNHYSLANKLIIIAPKKATKETFMQKLKDLLPLTIIALVASGLIRLITLLRSQTSKLLVGTPLREATIKAQEVGSMRGGNLITRGVSNISQAAEPVIRVTQLSKPNPALWFLLGALFIILLLLLRYLLVTRKKKA
ncbi:MAG TPA: ArsR family transcriptional regulator [Candidatus Woesearchaeota archaeon]|nr:ArsR family transcriptional regulator [Candidatus Woesearchaeota archaeon]